MVASLEIRGLVETQRKLEQTVADLQGEELLSGMRRATLLVQRDAKRLSPVDTGRLRASIVPEIRQRGNTIQGVVGSNVIYAAAAELGSRPHYPPISALQTWASRHGMNAYVLQRAIGRRGTKAHRFFQQSFAQNRDRIVELIGDSVARIINK
jgi:phage gpG-like protein